MPNPIKYSTSTQSQALNDGNFWIGTNDVPKGISEDRLGFTGSGFYNSVTPTFGGYTIYAYHPTLTGSMSYTSITNDAQLVTITNRDYSTSFTTATQCLAYFATQSNSIIFNKDYEAITTNGIVSNLDVTFSPSYPRTGNTLYDIGGSAKNGVLTNGASYSGTSVYFDSVDDYILFSNAATYSNWTVNLWSNNTFSTASLTHNTIFNIYPSSGNANTEGWINIFLTMYYNINSIALDTSGKIYVGGQFEGVQDTRRPFFVRLNTDGTLDTTFDYGFTFSNVVNSTYEAFTFHSSGDIYTSGTNIGSLGIRRITSTGSKVSEPLASSGGSGPSITSGGLLLDETLGKMWAYGHWATSYNGTSRLYITKMNVSDYSIDTTFNASTGFNTSDVYSAFLDANKDLYLAGAFTQYKSATASRIVKINGTSSATDTSFSTGTGFNNTVWKIMQTSDGKIMAAGQFTSYNGTAINRVVKLNTDGTIDNTFVVGTGFNAIVNSFDIQSDGKIVFVGNFTSYNGTASNRIIRLNTNGSVDTGFSIGTGLNAAGTAVKIQSDGKILVGVGTRFSYNSQITTSGIFRLNSDGSVDTGFNIGVGINLALWRDFVQVRIAGNVYQGILGGVSNINERSPQSTIFPIFSGWRMYTISFNSTTKAIKVYLDGVLRSTTTTTGSVNMTAQMSQIWGYGYIGPVQLYNKVLTDAEILNNYNSQNQIVSDYTNRVSINSGTVESTYCITNALANLNSKSLLRSATFVLIPNGYKSGFVYSQLPNTSNGDLSITRTTTATRMNERGLIESVASGVPQIDYSLGGCPVLLLEPQRTNVCQTSDPSSGGVGSGAGSVTFAANDWGIGLTNKMTLTKPTSSDGALFYSTTPVVGGTTYTISAYVKIIDGQTGTPVFGSVTNNSQGYLQLAGTPINTDGLYTKTDMGNSLWRISATATSTATQSGSTGFLRWTQSTVRTGSIEVSGLQVEVNTAANSAQFVTSYIPNNTGSGSVTRNGTTFNRSNVYTNGLISASGGTWFVDIKNNLSLTSDAGLAQQLGLGNNTIGASADNIWIGTGASTARLRVWKQIAGTLSVVYNTTTTNVKLAMKWNGATMSVFANGSQVATSAFTPVALESLKMISTGYPYYISQMALWNTPLTDAQCISLSS